MRKREVETEMTFDLDLGLNGKVVLITGAGGGIGLSTVQAFLATGALVVATDVNISLLQELVSDNCFNNLLIVEKDISNVDACRELISQTIEHFDRQRGGREDPRHGARAHARYRRFGG